MTRYVLIPVKACHRCEQGYDLEEWRELRLVEMVSEPCRGHDPCGQLHTIEVRRCRGRTSAGPCRAELRLDVTDVESLDLEVTTGEFRLIYPDSTRPELRGYEKDAPPSATWAQLLMGVVLVLVVASIVAAVAAAMQGAL